MIFALLLAVPVALAAAPPDPATWVEVRGLATATAPSGEVWLAWSADDGTDAELYSSRWNGQTWSSPQRVHTNPSAWDDIPSLAIGPDGTAWLAWTASDGSTSDLYLSHWLGYRWSKPETVPVDGLTNIKEPALAVAPDGALWLAWVGFDGVDDEVLVNRWNGRSWSVRQVSDNDDERTLYDRQPKLAVGQDGRPWLVWTGHQSGVDNEIYFSRWTGSAWTPEQMLSTDDDLLDTQPALTLDAQGQPWVAWEGRATEGEHSALRILVSHWDEARSAWTAESVASSPLLADVQEERPALALDSSGQMHLAWVASRGGNVALAHARWQAGAWTEPRLASEHVNAYRVALAPTAAEPLLVWDSPALGAQFPVESAPVAETDALLSTWLEAPTVPAQIEGVDPIPNRYLAFGDSITWGQYPVDNPTQPPFYPYPSILEDTLDVRVMDANVRNAGVPGEGTGNGRDRIKDEVEDFTPQYVMIMEGTNNVSHSADPADIKEDYLIMIDNAKRHAGVDHVKVMMATIIPRLDDKNDETYEMNQEAVIPAANQKNIPICDQWQRFIDYGDYAQIYWDEKHPDQEGLQIFAGKWYDCLLATYSWLNEETEPPTAWVSSLPAQSECGQVDVSWTGSDNLTPVESLVYDVQMNVNGGAFADWMMGTQQTSGSTYSSNFGEVIGFQVRARDIVGNVGDYSPAAYTTISDGDPPQALADPLPQVQLAPFTVNWSGSDACSEVVAYLPQYRVGAGDWQNMLPSPYTTTNTSASFDPGSPQYGETYTFRVQAQDQGGNWSPWSNEVQTKLARFTAKGHVTNLRHQPVAAAQVDLDPPSMATLPVPGGGFAAYLAAAGDYDLTTARDDLYGSLPTMWNLPVAGDVSGLEFVLPPQDDAVTDGGFEGGSSGWAAWQVDGSAPPTLTVEAHTGLGAVELGGVGEDAHLSQVVTPALTISDPTLSFMIRLETAGPASTVEVELSNSGILSPPVTYTLAVDSADWSHAWFDLDGLAGEPLTLTLTVSDSAAVLVDEISMGSALRGSYPTYLPLILKDW